MNQDDSSKKDENEISVNELISIFKSGLRYILSKWILLFLFALIGSVLGVLYSISQKPSYTAVCTFVLEDSKSGSLGQFAGLASLAGLNMGGSGGGVFEGDNILELYKSRLMIEKTLLSAVVINNKQGLLIERYIDQNRLRKKWSDDPQLANIHFNGNSDTFNRQQDSIVTALTEQINTNVLTVTKPDKKLNIIRVEVVTKDELFSKYFTENLVQNVNDFYQKTTTKKSMQNVQILQHQVDSIKNRLNADIHGVASAVDAAPNANPLLSTLRENSQKKQVDVQSNAAIYGEMEKNLELSKMTLMDQMPLIQIIDKPILPLAVKRFTKVKGIVIGAIIGLFFGIGFVFFKRKKASLR
jgi:uncharacterized protein involved in exopolysaccharide biosynthesis